MEESSAQPDSSYAQHLHLPVLSHFLFIPRSKRDSKVQRQDFNRHTQDWNSDLQESPGHLEDPPQRSELYITNVLNINLNSFFAHCEAYRNKKLL